MNSHIEKLQADIFHTEIAIKKCLVEGDALEAGCWRKERTRLQDEFDAYFKVLPCPFCGFNPNRFIADAGAPYPGGHFEICCENEECSVGPCLSEKRRTDLKGKTHAEAEDLIWIELIAKWNIRHHE